MSMFILIYKDKTNYLDFRICDLNFKLFIESSVGGNFVAAGSYYKKILAPGAWGQADPTPISITADIFFKESFCDFHCHTTAANKIDAGGERI